MTGDVLLEKPELMAYLGYNTKRFDNELYFRFPIVANGGNIVWKLYKQLSVS